MNFQMLDKIKANPNYQKYSRPAAFGGAGIIFAVLLLLGGLIIGINYPTWYQDLPFKDSLPGFLKPQVALLQSTTSGGKTIVRTVEESAVIDVVDKSSAAVVSIVAKTANFDPSSGSVNNDEQGIGTGFIVDPSGIIITNNHVVCDTSVDYAVVTRDKKTYDVKKIDLDPANDIAIIKIGATNLPFLAFGNSDPSVLKPGQKVIAIGNALGQFQNTVTVGVVSGLGRGITAAGSGCGGQSQETLENVIQTDAALNPGNSGGPLIDLSGQVIGVNFAVSSNAQNIGFVIPIDRVKPIMEAYRKDGRLIKPYLGVGITRYIDNVTARVYRIPEGAVIGRVVSGAPADKAGVQRGDILTKIGDQTVSQDNDVVTIMGSLKVGQKVALEVYRDSKTVKLSATLTESPSN